MAWQIFFLPYFFYTFVLTFSARLIFFNQQRRTPQTAQPRQGQVLGAELPETPERRWDRSETNMAGGFQGQSEGGEGMTIT